MTLNVDDSHTPSVLSGSSGETGAEERPLAGRTMPSVSLADRRRERKARKLARLLVALDDGVRVERRRPPRRTLRQSLSGAR
jgi:hypothetical protein